MENSVRFKTSNRGFSLVELIVVVAVIGILASIVVPQYEKFSFRAKNSEAKVQLGGLFSAEKAFYAEYQAYHSRFPAIGFSPEGNMHYNVGFGGVTAFEAGATQGYFSSFPANYYSTRQYCDNMIDLVPGSPGNGCKTIATYFRYSSPPLIGGGFVVSIDDFMAAAVIQAPGQLLTQLEDAPATMVANLFGIAVTEAHAEPVGRGIRFYLLGMNSSKSFTSTSCDMSGQSPNVVIGYSSGTYSCPPPP